MMKLSLMMFIASYPGMRLTAPSSAVQVEDLSSVYPLLTWLIVELFKRRLQIAKNVCVDFDEVLPFYKPSSTEGTTEEPEVTDSKTAFALPSKTSAEKLVNSFFNTWQPLFPVLHRPSFLWDFDAMYKEKGLKDPARSAQFWLVLAIAARDAITKV